MAPAVSKAWPRIVIHADMDAFYAAVEQLDNPELAGQPILVGPRSRRGVVLTASYEARPYKVGSAMPMAEALRRCPQAIVVPPRFKRYAELSAAIMAVFADFSPEVEPLSLDEAFLDMTGAEHIFGPPREMGCSLQDAVRQATNGLEVSVGIAHTKYVAKVASGISKPRGLEIVPLADAVTWLAPLPVARLWGAGPKTQAKLIQCGYNTIGDIAAADPRMLEQQLGSAGLQFFELAHARDPRRVEGSRRSKSMGSDRTLQHDVKTPADIQRHLRRSADRIARRLRKKNLSAGGVRVRLKTTEFKLLSRQCTLTEPTDIAEVIYQAGIRLLGKFDHPGPVRLVGMAAHTLTRHEQPAQIDLLADPSERNLETTLDAIVERFGEDSIKRARDVASETVSDSEPDLDFLTK